LAAFCLAGLYLWALFLSPKGQIRFAITTGAIAPVIFALGGYFARHSISFSDAGPGLFAMALGVAMIFSSAVIALIGWWRGRRRRAAQLRADTEAFGSPT
jgi:hypothetical protein